MQTLNYFAQNRINATVIDKYSTILVIKDGKIQLPPMPDKYFSVFSMGEEAQGVSIKGAKYPLDNYTMTNAYPVGISNEFKEIPVEISVEKGNLLVILTQKD